VSAESLERLERADLCALVLELEVFLVFLATVHTVLPLALQTAAGCLLVLGTLVLGLLLPLGLHLTAAVTTPRRTLAAALCALVGGLALRVGLLQSAPDLLEHWPALTSSSRFWYTVVGASVALLAVCTALTIPALLNWQRRLTNRQSALVGLAALLFCVAIFHALSTTVEQTVSERGLRFSVEDGRERGGGPGASELNRPDDVPLRSKITGSLPDEP
jgi:hypothetical protein